MGRVYARAAFRAIRLPAVRATVGLSDFLARWNDGEAA
jgi:hypothetical protein